MTYKDCGKVFLGASDIASVILRTPNEVNILKFGSDGTYSAYFIDADKGECEIGEHYKEEFAFSGWLKVYDDDMVQCKLYAESIKVYRAGDFGCIIKASGVDYANSYLVFW